MKRRGAENVERGVHAASTHESKTGLVFLRLTATDVEAG